MSSVDLARVRDLLGSIQDARRRLGELAQLSLEEFTGDFRNTESAKHRGRPDSGQRNAWDVNVPAPRNHDEPRVS